MGHGNHVVTCFSLNLVTWEPRCGSKPAAVLYPVGPVSIAIYGCSSLPKRRDICVGKPIKTTILGYTLFLGKASLGWQSLPTDQPTNRCIRTANVSGSLPHAGNSYLNCYHNVCWLNPTSWFVESNVLLVRSKRRIVSDPWARLMRTSQAVEGIAVGVEPGENPVESNE